LKLLLVMFAFARTVALGFDHHAHDGKLDIAAKTPPPCTACHRMEKGKLVGRPDHASCFGACHGATPATPRRGGKIELGDRQKVCESCHAEVALVAPFAGKLPVHYPPYKLDQDFNLGFGHKMHAKADCAGCHLSDKKPTPHSRCIECHDKTMDKCGGCHPPASGKPQPPELQALHDTVGSAFSHKTHAARGEQGKACATCHAAITTTDDSELPRPKVTACASCHDGKAAFATTEACTRCHPNAPPADERYTVYRPTERFTHGGPHADAVAKEPCSTCHVVRAGEVASAGHKPCAGCHASDFGARKPTICGACHYASEPWRHLAADRGPAEKTEIGATLDHRKHTAACDTCHQLRTASSQLRPPRGHRACTACHATGPAPHLDQCDACHNVGMLAARQAARAKDPWSVRTAFDHAAHTKTACTDCHLDLAADTLLAIPTPPKKTCEPCHDGERAFSLTGTTCTRCHEGKPK
jgi:c(7)-type cytochrome triheme protein